jgi:hypothetical protein
MRSWHFAVITFAATINGKLRFFRYKELATLLKAKKAAQLAAAKGK